MVRHCTKISFCRQIWRIYMTRYIYMCGRGIKYNKIRLVDNQRVFLFIHIKRVHFSRLHVPTRTSHKQRHMWLITDTTRIIYRQTHCTETREWQLSERSGWNKNKVNKYRWTGFNTFLKILCTRVWNSCICEDIFCCTCAD